MAPIELLHDAQALTSRTTLIHATHLDARALDLLASHRPTVCACPTTERNLGDGFLPALPLLLRHVPIALGTDSQADIDLWEDARLVEYHERLRYERRNVLAAAWPVWHPERVREERREVGELLLPMLNLHGARALGWDALGEIRPGARADLVALDLKHPSLWGLEPERAAAMLPLSTKTGAVTHLWVGATRVVRDRALCAITP